ncbi:hypothetical protein AB0892_02345 [Streptomyces sp. NPDC005409]
MRPIFRRPSPALRAGDADRAAACVRAHLDRAATLMRGDAR